METRMITKTPILPNDIRKGDHVRRVYRDDQQRLCAWEFWAIGERLSNVSGEFFLLDRPVPDVVLPVTPGWYCDYQYDTWRLNTSGQWDCIESPSDSENPAQYAPFTRLEPEAVTAKKVLEKVSAQTTAHCLGCTEHLSRIAATFGVVL